ncbi:hypothetical protein Tco_1248954, partial [Tanacetum coccineum]
RDKSGLGYGNQIHEGVLSYEKEVLESLFDSRPSDVEDSHVNDRFAKVEGMHVVLPPMTGNYMPPKYDFGIDDVETLESVPEPVVVEPKVVSQPKVWSDAPIIEEYESDSDDEYVDNPQRALKNKVIVDSGCSRHMTGNKAYLAEYQDYNGGPIAFGGSCEALAIPGQTTTGKESSNPLMAHSLPKTIQSNDPPLLRGYTLGSGEDSLELMELMAYCTNLYEFVSKKNREIK